MQNNHAQCFFFNIYITYKRIYFLQYMRALLTNAHNICNKIKREKHNLSIRNFEIVFFLNHLKTNCFRPRKILILKNYQIYKNLFFKSNKKTPSYLIHINTHTKVQCCWIVCFCQYIVVAIVYLNMLCICVMCFLNNFFFFFFQFKK